jgi:glycosyltransferase involved in cell wall biosynthesis
MKIAMVNMFYKPTIGGVEQVMYELGQRLIKEGHEVHVFCCDSDKNKRLKVKEEIIDGVYVHRLPYWFRLSLFTFVWPSLLWRLPKYKFDIVHSHVSGHLYILISGLVCKLKGWKHVHTTHCPWTDAFRSWLLKPFVFLNDLFLNKLSFKMCDKIIAITPWEFGRLRKYGVTRKQLGLIPNGMDDIHFKIIKPNNFKKKLGIGNKKLVLFFGRFNVTKGPDKFVLAAKEILKERNDVFFLMRGPDEGVREKIEKMVEGVKGIKVMYETRNKKEIAEMYQSSDVFVMPSYREGLPLCCHPDTLIQTEEGLKKISEIKLNEMVLSHKGRFCKVTKIMKRYIDEEIISIKPYGINQEIEITKEHPVLSIKKPKKKFKKLIGKIITKSNPLWVRSQELKKGDCVVFPIPKYSSNIKYFDLVNFDSSLECSSSYVWYKNGFSGKKKKNSYSSLMKKTGETKKVIESAINYMKKGNLPAKSKRIGKMLDFLNKSKFVFVGVNKYPRFIEIDNQLAYVFGWYIAEGSAGKGFVRFALNKKEIEYAHEINNIISRKFGVKGKISIKNNNLSLVFCGKILVSLFSELCGKGARNKRIPRELFNKKLLPYVLKGLFLGDGHFNKAGWRLSTISRQLANDVVLALLKLKKKFNFHKSKRGLYNITYQPNNPDICHSNKSWFVGDSLCFMIKDIRRRRYRGIVYNLEVEKDNSYTTSAFCVHNCLFEAMAAGLPIVASPCNGVPYEMKDGVNGFLVKYGDIKGLKKSILRILDNKNLARKFSKNNRKKSKNYNWDIISKRYGGVYGEVVGNI